MQVSFVPKEGRRERWEIFVEEKDGGKFIGQSSVLNRFSLHFSWFRFSAVFDGYEYRRVKNYVLWRLSKQSYHSEQLSKLLRERLVQEKTIHYVLKEFQDAGYINDDAWLKAFLRSQQKRSGLPVILSKLRVKGLSSHTLQNIDESWNDAEEELRAIQHLMQTRYRLKNLTDYKTRQKVFASLMRKGFAYEQVKAALNNLDVDVHL